MSFIGVFYKCQDMLDKLKTNEINFEKQNSVSHFLTF